MKYKILHKINDEYLKEALALDDSVFAKVDLTSFEKCKEWLRVNNEIYTLILHNDKLIGYINFIGISEECFIKFKDGRYKDYLLEKDDIVPFHKGENKALFMSIVIKKEYRDTDAIVKLTNAFKKKIKKYRRKGILFNDCVVDCVSVDGVKYSMNNFQSKYLCDSLNGKIFSINVYAKPRKKLKLTYELLDKNNVKIAGLLQYKVFKEDHWCGYSDYLDEVNSREKQKFPIDYLVYYNKKPVGVVGLYKMDKRNKNEIWLNWFCVLPEYRLKGIGTQMLFFIIEKARNLNQQIFRAVTFESWNQKAQGIYKKTMQQREMCYYYYYSEKPIIFSSSLVDKHCPKWGKRKINEQVEWGVHDKSLELLKRDNII